VQARTVISRTHKDKEMAEKVNIQKSFSNVNEKLTKLFDESGVRRSFTIPYVDGQNMSDHVSAVGQISAQAGGLGNNLLTTSHHSDGKGYGSGDGHTVGHPSEKLRNTVIPKDDKNAKAALDAASQHLKNVGKIVGDDNPDVKTSEQQLALAQKTDAAGMTLLDLGVMIQQLMFKPNQALARAHHLANGGVPGAVQSAPSSQDGQEGGGEAPEEGAEQAAPAEGDQPAGGAQEAAPEAQAAPAGAPAAPESQG
jgi:hypothetical protein